MAYGETDDDFDRLFGGHEPPLSPFEQALGGRYEEGMPVSAEAEAVFESGGAVMPGGSPGPTRKVGPIPGTTETPREVFKPEIPNEPPPGPGDGVGVRPPSSGRGSSTPARPRSPQPVSASAPAPFSPLPASDPSSLTVSMRAPYMSEPVQFGEGSGQAAFGSMEGLLGGGVGLPDDSGISNNPMLFALLRALMGK